jgi:hypothetical protein
MAFNFKILLTLIILSLNKIKVIKTDCYLCLIIRKRYKIMQSTLTILYWEEKSNRSYQLRCPKWVIDKAWMGSHGRKKTALGLSKDHSSLLENAIWKKKIMPSFRSMWLTKHQCCSPNKVHKAREGPRTHISTEPNIWLMHRERLWRLRLAKRRLTLR